MKLSNIALLLADNRGTYIPQHFAEDFDMAEWHVSEDDAAILRAGQDHELYWETWDSALQSARYTSDDGRIYSLYQDSDLFAIAIDAITDSEYREFFGDSVLTRWVDVDTTAPK